ncbi:hypothetical protein M1D51_12580 [Arthrobacter sp. R3-55]
MPNNYQDVFNVAEAAWAELDLTTDRGTFRVSTAAVEAGLRELLGLYEEVEDLPSLRQLTLAQWLRTFSDWEIRWQRSNYLLMDSLYATDEEEPPVEVFELRAAIGLSAVGHPVIELASRWAGVSAGKPLERNRDADPYALMGSSYKDPTAQGPERNFELLEENLVGGLPEDPSGPHRVYGLGWSSKDIDRPYGLLA